MTVIYSPTPCNIVTSPYRQRRGGNLPPARIPSPSFATQMPPLPLGEARSNEMELSRKLQSVKHTPVADVMKFLVLKGAERLETQEISRGVKPRRVRSYGGILPAAIRRDSLYKRASDCNTQTHSETQSS